MSGKRIVWFGALLLFMLVLTAGAIGIVSVDLDNRLSVITHDVVVLADTVDSDGEATVQNQIQTILERLGSTKEQVRRAAQFSLVACLIFVLILMFYQEVPIKLRLTMLVLGLLLLARAVLMPVN